jgi:Lrp/AsnC family leucine-responsive transcriptional regulator
VTSFDETDLEILRLLLADGRRPYSSVAEAVGLSGPAVSDRVDRLAEAGVLQGFTVDVNRSRLAGDDPLLLELAVPPAAAGAARDDLLAAEAVEHVFLTAEGRLFASAYVPAGDARDLLADAGLLDDLQEFRVHALTDATWNPGLGAEGFAVECAECGNSVDEEGTATTLSGDRYRFCCSSCEAAFVDRYESMAEEA